MDDSRNPDFLKLIIACGLAVRGKKENDLSRELMTAVEEKNLRRMNSLDVNMKDLAIATMLIRSSFISSIYSLALLICRKASTFAKTMR